MIAAKELICKPKLQSFPVNLLTILNKFIFCCSANFRKLRCDRKYDNFTLYAYLLCWI